MIKIMLAMLAPNLSFGQIFIVEINDLKSESDLIHGYVSLTRFESKFRLGCPKIRLNN